MTSPIRTGVYFVRNLASRTVLTLNEGSIASGTAIVGQEQFAYSDGRVAWQLWTVVEQNSVYTFESARGQTFIDLENGLVANGTRLVGYNQNSDVLSQQWQIIPDASEAGLYVIKNQLSNTYMDLQDGSDTPGTPVQIWEGSNNTGNTHQVWQFIRATE